MTRDETLAHQVLQLLFCKLLDEGVSAPDDVVAFQVMPSESAGSLRARIDDLFARVQAKFPHVFDRSETLKLDPGSVEYVVRALQAGSLRAAGRDVIGDAFETFIGPALRGGDGQFFTPRNVVQMIVDLVDPEPEHVAIDPACGAAGFLVAIVDRVFHKLESRARIEGWAPSELHRRKEAYVSRCLIGIEKDEFLARVARAYLTILGETEASVFCENSLVPPNRWKKETRENVRLAEFDLVLTNPPFGARIPVSGRDVLAQYDLGRKWKRRKDGRLEPTDSIHSDQPPQVLFLERSLQLLRPGGRLGIVLPESMLGNPSYEHVVRWLLSTTEPLAVVTMPEALFKTSGKGGTHTKACVLLVRKRGDNSAPPPPFFMAEAKWCGHDSRGNPTLRAISTGGVELLDDLPTIVGRFREFEAGRLAVQDHLGFLIGRESIRNHILVPKYYEPEISAHLSQLETTHELRTMGSLVERGLVSITTGVEVGKMAYGTGTIPFVRTSDLSSWEIKLDPKHGVSEEIYNTLRRKAEVRPGDILMVRDGTYLIGTSAIVTAHDRRMLFQSHIFRIRSTRPELLDPFLLFAALNSPIVKRQIRTKQFTQDIIDTLGNRILEVVVPLPRDERWRSRIATGTREIVLARSELRERARKLALQVEGDVTLDDEDRAALDDL